MSYSAMHGMRQRYYTKTSCLLKHDCASHLKTAIIRLGDADAYHSYHLDFGVRLWRLPHGAGAWVLRRRRAQPHPDHCSHSALAQNRLGCSNAHHLASCQGRWAGNTCSRFCLLASAVLLRLGFSSSVEGGFANGRTSTLLRSGFRAETSSPTGNCKGAQSSRLVTCLVSIAWVFVF